MLDPRNIEGAEVLTTYVDSREEIPRLIVLANNVIYIRDYAAHEFKLGDFYILDVTNPTLYMMRERIENDNELRAIYGNNY